MLHSQYECFECLLVEEVIEGILFLLNFLCTMTFLVVCVHYKRYMGRT